jgi:hypothetical protein
MHGTVIKIKKLKSKKEFMANRPGSKTAMAVLHSYTLFFQ